jgi:hypothetical protein
MIASCFPDLICQDQLVDGIDARLRNEKLPKSPFGLEL